MNFQRQTVRKLIHPVKYCSYGDYAEFTTYPGYLVSRTAAGAYLTG
ncbi:MAG: hypothetical protein V1736_10345 [Pseudomonadota bacterium]